MGPYTKDIKKAEDDIKAATKKVKELAGIKESDTGLGPPSLWDLAADKQMMQEEQALQVARCTKIINPGTEDAKYVINIKQVRSQLPSPAQPSPALGQPHGPALTALLAAASRSPNSWWPWATRSLRQTSRRACALALTARSTRSRFRCPLRSIPP